MLSTTLPVCFQSHRYKSQEHILYKNMAFQLLWQLFVFLLGAHQSKIYNHITPANKVETKEDNEND